MTASAAERLPARGSCAGYQLHSALAFHALRPGGGGEPLEVHEGSRPPAAGEVVATWQPRPDNPFHGRLLQDGHRFAFWASDAGWYRIDPRRMSISVDAAADPVRRELRLFGIPAAVCAFASGDLPLHASAVDIGGNGVLLAGPTMHGKTTLAAAFAAAGHRLLAEDTIRCALGPEPVIYPGPAVVRLRADVAGALQLPGTSPLATPPESERIPLAFTPALRGSGAPVPLRAILFLHSQPEPPVLEPMAAPDAARDLFTLAFRLATDASRAECFRRVVDLSARVNTLVLRRPMTIDALPDVISLVERHLAARS